jgi:hypothetical protein
MCAPSWHSVSQPRGHNLKCSTSYRFQVKSEATCTGTEGVVLAQGRTLDIQGLLVELDGAAVLALGLEQVQVLESVLWSEGSKVEGIRSKDGPVLLPFFTG